MSFELYETRKVMSIPVEEIKLLRLAVEKGIIDTNLLDQRLKEMKKKEYLDNHEFKIWQGSNGYWYTYVDVCGKRKLIRKKERETLDEALIKFYEGNNKTLSPTFKEEYHSWIESKKKYNEVKTNTIFRYEDDYRRYFKGTTFEKTKVKSIDDLVLDEFIRTSIATHKMTAKAYSCFRTVIIGTLKHAKRYHHTDFSPAVFFKDFELSKSVFKKPSEKRKNVYKKDERALLYGYLMSNPTIQNLGLAFMCLTGLRVGELAALKKEDNVECCKMYIHRTESRAQTKTGKKIVVVQDTSKMDHDETIIIPKDAQKIVDMAYMISHDDEYLFSENGARVTTQSFRRWLKKACDEVGIEYRSPHQMRKTYASILLASGVDEAIVKREMRHTDIATTRAYYQYITENEDKEKAIIDRVMGIM